MRKGQTASTPWEDQHHAAQAYYHKLWLKLAVGLRQQAARRAARAQARAIEAKVRHAAGSFREFQLELVWERQTKGKGK